MSQSRPYSPEDAVRHPGAEVLIEAGPGSGKTRVLVRRASWLVNKNGLPPNQLRLLAFTRNAVGEFTSRLSIELGPGRVLRTSTVHGAAAELLLAHVDDYGRQIDLRPNFRILTEDRAINQIKRAMKRVGYESEDEGQEDEEAKHLYQLFAVLRARKASVKQALRAANYKVFEAYQDLLQRENALDMPELIERASRLLLGCPDVRVQTPTGHVLVDEAQDLDRAQFEFILLLAQGAGLTMVADPDQSIYGWRGADPSLLNWFREEGAGRHVVPLPESHRSTETILRAAAAVIERQERREPRPLVAIRGPGPGIRKVDGQTPEDEAIQVVRWINSLREQDREIAWKDVAVLARTNAQLAVVERCFLKEGVPYQIGGPSFFERQGPRELVAYLRCLAGDPAGLKELLLCLPRGATAGDWEQLEQWMSETNAPLRSVIDGNGNPPIGMVARCALRSIGGVLREIERRGRKDQGSATLLDLVKTAMRASGLNQLWKLTKSSAWAAASPPKPESENDWSFPPDEDITFLGQVLQAQFRGPWGDSLEKLANLVSRVRRRDLDPVTGLQDFTQGETAADVSVDAVQLLTVHQAKGLQFRAVGVIGCEKSFFPKRTNALRDLRPRSEREPEERRLFYVAMTRAQDHLALFRARRRETGRNWSTYVTDIPEEYVTDGL